MKTSSRSSLRIKSIRTDAHEGCNVYVRHFESVGAGETFEYLTVIDGEIYAFPITMRKPMWKRILRIPFTDAEIKKITEYIISAAYTTIETVQAQKNLSAPKSRSKG